jgi:dihydropteroate synthase
MQTRAAYTNVVEEVLEELGQRVKAAERAGIDRSRLAVDPGLGFAKTADHNWALLAGLERLHRLELPVLVAASRKTFLGRLLADQETGELRPTRDRDDASSATSALAAMAGAWCVRVHAVRPSLDAVRVAARWAAEPHGD